MSEKLNAKPQMPEAQPLGRSGCRTSSVKLRLGNKFRVAWRGFLVPVSLQANE